MESTWLPLGPSIERVLDVCDDPMGTLARGEVPALLVRKAYPPEQCREIVNHFYERGLVPGLPKPGELIPERPKIERVDVGTSLGNLGKKPEEFFEGSKATHELYETLFEGLNNPIDLMYGAMERLAPGKKAMVAREPDGRLYGPVIFRCHLPHWGYSPHIDSVRKREKRTNYEVHRFEHQLAGILLLQPPERSEGYCDSILHKCPWNDKVAEIMKTDLLGRRDKEGIVIDPKGFAKYAQENNIKNYRMILEAGDMYFFNSEMLHEIPRFDGHSPRIVMATFFGYSPDDPEIYVWA